MPSLRSVFRNLLVGKDEFILSHTQYKRILLTGQLSLISFSVCAFYLVFDLLQGLANPWPFQATCAALSLISLLLNRAGKFSFAKILLGISVNFTVYFFASIEPMEVGLYMYFIIGNIGALVAFGHEEMGKAVFFVFLSTGLFFLALYLPVTFIERPIYTHEYIVFNTILNFIGASFASAAMIYFLININHRAEAQLRLNEKDLTLNNGNLLKLNAQLDRFATITSHDLKAPLNSILGLVQLVEVSTNLEEVRQYTGMIKTRASDLNNFITELAEHSRTAGSQVNLTKVRVRKTVRNALESLMHLPDAERLAIHIEIDEAIEITSDTMRLQIIFNNILSNAIKYQDKQKANSFIKISGFRTDQNLKILIEDNGLGISESNVSKIFEMYYRAHDHVEGTGLGLYIVKETIEKLRGEIKLESKEGHGTKFELILPDQSIANNSVQVSIL